MKLIYKKTQFKSKFNDFIKGPYGKFVIIILIGLIIGSVHGFYVSAQKYQKNIRLYANDMCNGEYASGSFKVTPSISSLNVNYRLILSRGRMIFEITNPHGEAVYYKNDISSIFRQNNIKINDKSLYGTWNYKIMCEKADMQYDISINME